MEVEGKQIEFNDGISELHTSNFKEILSGGSYRVDAFRQAHEILREKYPFLG